MKKHLLHTIACMAAATLFAVSCNKGDAIIFNRTMPLTVKTLDPYTCYFVGDDGTLYYCLTSLKDINAQMTRPLLNRDRVYATILGKDKPIPEGYDYGCELGMLFYPVVEEIKPYPAEGGTESYGDDEIEIADGQLGAGYINLMVQYPSNGKTEHGFTLLKIDDPTHEDYEPEYGLYELRHDAKGDSGIGIIQNILCFELDPSEYDNGAVILVPDGGTGGKKVRLAARRGMQEVVDKIKE